MHTFSPAKMWITGLGIIALRTSSDLIAHLMHPTYFGAWLLETRDIKRDAK
jgi:hypothetical protein